MKYIKYTAEWLIELLLIVFHFPMYLLNEVFPLKSVHENPTQKYTVILVERWFRHNVFHIFAKWYLENKGYRTYTINYSLAKGTFEKAGLHLQRFIITKKLDNVVLIGISAGALTCMYYLQKLNGWEKTVAFISLGGPLKGTPLAKLFPVNKSVREVQVNSDFIKDLYDGGIKQEDKIYSLHAISDNLVPVKYSQLPGAHNIQIDMVGHNLFHTFWIPTWKKVTDILQNL